MQDPQELIVEIIKEKGILKQDVYNNLLTNFQLLKETLKSVAEDLEDRFEQIDNRIRIEYIDKSEFEAHLRVAGDLLIFHMHTNVFQFDGGHNLWRSSYLKKNPARGYCGIINIYNFLSDSFKYNRPNDLGYMIARIFINHENHFKVEGKRQLGFLYNDFVNATINQSLLKSIVQSAILYTLDFDLFTPNYDQVKEVYVHEMHTMSSNLVLKTGKRLGFKFQADTDQG